MVQNYQLALRVLGAFVIVLLHIAQLHRIAYHKYLAGRRSAQLTTALFRPRTYPSTTEFLN